jgi:hypothetical protein
LDEGAGRRRLGIRGRSRPLGPSEALAEGLVGGAHSIREQLKGRVASTAKGADPTIASGIPRLAHLGVYAFDQAMVEQSLLARGAVGTQGIPRFRERVGVAPTAVGSKVTIAAAVDAGPRQLANRSRSASVPIGGGHPLLTGIAERNAELSTGTNLAVGFYVDIAAARTTHTVLGPTGLGRKLPANVGIAEGALEQLAREPEGLG